MKRYVFRLTICGGDRHRRRGEIILTDHIVVETRSMNAAWVKAAKLAGRVCKSGEVIHDLTWESVGKPIPRTPMPPAVN